jgi:hypothetical protein
VGPRAGLDAVVRRKIPSSCRDSNPRSSNPTTLRSNYHIPLRFTFSVWTFTSISSKAVPWCAWYIPTHRVSCRSIAISMAWCCTRLDTPEGNKCLGAVAMATYGPRMAQPSPRQYSDNNNTATYRYRVWWNWSLTSVPHIVPRLRMRECIPPHPHTYRRCGC